MALFLAQLPKDNRSFLEVCTVLETWLKCKSLHKQAQFSEMHCVSLQRGLSYCGACLQHCHRGGLWCTLDTLRTEGTPAGHAKVVVEFSAGT